MVRLTDRPDMSLDVYLGRKTSTQQQQVPKFNLLFMHNKKGLRYAKLDYVCN